MKKKEILLFFEDMNVGDIEISDGRTITETDIVNFAGLSGDYNVIHTDAEFTKKSFFQQRVAHGLLIQAIASGLYTRTMYNHGMGNNLTAFSEIRYWRFQKPVFIGDTIRVKQELIEKSNKYPEKNSGQVIFKRQVLNQNDDVVQEGEYIMLIKKRKTLKETI